MMGKVRREQLKKQLLGRSEPIKAADFSHQYGVSRQTIVVDIAMLRAEGEKIISTPQGYQYERDLKYQQMVICRHFADQAEDELKLIVDNNVVVKDVVIDHPLYGQLSGQLNLKNINDVEQFVHGVREKKTHLLSELTDGIHSHTLMSDEPEAIENLIVKLRREGFLYRGQ